LVVFFGRCNLLSFPMVVNRKSCLTSFNRSRNEGATLIQTTGTRSLKWSRFSILYVFRIKIIHYICSPNLAEGVSSRVQPNQANNKWRLRSIGHPIPSMLPVVSWFVDHSLRADPEYLPLSRDRERPPSGVDSETCSTLDKRTKMVRSREHVLNLSRVKLKEDDKRFKKYPFKGTFQPPLQRRSSVKFGKRGDRRLKNYEERRYYIF